MTSSQLLSVPASQAQEALDYHRTGRKGKIAIVATKPAVPRRTRLEQLGTKLMSV
jgi:hypothetical protein